ncbi:MAG: zinc/manganese transport system substrate-binding protein [Thermoproteota archaeon]|jgi:zinc/manganese transport system substrate-binding protein
MFFKKFNLIVFIILFNTTSYAQNIITTLPEFSWIVKRLAPNVEVHSLLEGSEDPHFVDASPSFVFKAAKADLVIFNGMELEIGWLPKILEMSGNSKVQVGSTGYCDASLKVSKIGIVKNYNRSMGDIHPAGNPHYSMSLPRMVESAESIKNCLLVVLKNKDVVNKNYTILKKEINTLFKKLKGIYKANIFYVYHREFNYLAKDFDLVLKESLEKVPGVLPSATYITKMAIKAKEDKPKLVLASNTSPVKVLEKFKELSGISYTRIPLHPKKGEDYLEFYEQLLKRINEIK